MTQRLLNTQDTIKYLGIARTMLYKLIESKELKPIKMGRDLRFDIEDLENFIKRKKEES